ncbi:DUF4194 domain-containing protein [uncultured Schumannella sp.]|uniref:DUF4194 domain-containing protein n=1 Tax=uncultured Schumannella sp. TaxID=1195956 RepID=UPI0025E8C514|nr:DUF4194 domain-containing protein [uncultured Schumannella sp.]
MLDQSEPGLWPGDAGVLAHQSRRALVSLVKGPYLARSQRRELWEALLADQESIRSRLNDMFLDLIIDLEQELAFVKPAELDDAPEVVRTRTLTFLDTATLLVLRQALLLDEGRGRVLIGLEEVAEHLAVYRKSRDEPDFRKRVNASWATMLKLGLLHQTDTERAEISPIVRYLIDGPRVATIQATYERLADNAPQRNGSGEAAEVNDDAP